MSRDHLVVVGGSIAGVLAAAAAADYFDHVTLIERDRLPDEAVGRKGAPQGNQIHILLPIGEERIARILPGIRGECIAAGFAEYNQVSDIPVLTGSGWSPRIKLESVDVVGFRRPLLELLVRRRLESLDNVEIVQGSVTGLVADRSGSVTGVTLKAGQVIAADLVVDAGGRGTKAPKWLSELGFEVPREDEVRVYMGYATQFVRVPDDAFEGDARGIASAPRPDLPVGGALIPADNGVHALAAIGLIKHYPPADPDGMLAFLAGAATPLLADIAGRSEPVSEVHTYRQPGNLRRRWEDLDRRLGRFLVLGDAVASFNPIYGQGITMAAIGATLLGDALAEQGTDLGAVAFETQRKLSRWVDVAFATAAYGDSFFRGVELINYEAPTDEEAEYMTRLEEVSMVDLEVRAVLIEAGALFRPEMAETEAIKKKVAAWMPPTKKPTVDIRHYPPTVQQGA